MIRITTLIAVVGTMLCACGPSDQEIKRQAEADLLARQAWDKHMADSAAMAHQNYQNVANALVNAKADLAVAADVVRRASDFRIGRARWEREEQIRNATVSMEQAKTRVVELEQLEQEWKHHSEALAAQVRR